jgi:sulfoxide reductase catalytic subunit YedY
MLIKKQTGMEIPSSEITPHHLYLSRRTFMQTATAVAAGALLAACRPDPPTAAEPVVAESTTAGVAPAKNEPTAL